MNHISTTRIVTIQCASWPSFFGNSTTWQSSRYYLRILLEYPYKWRLGLQAYRRITILTTLHMIHGLQAVAKACNTTQTTLMLHKQTRVRKCLPMEHLAIAVLVSHTPVHGRSTKATVNSSRLGQRNYQYEPRSSLEQRLASLVSRRW